MSQENQLNMAQQQAASHKNGPLLIIAGAGAGKTKTITERIVQLIKTGVTPNEILAVTFTNKAAKEMSERINRRLESSSELNRPISLPERPFVSTFHSLGVHIIKENATKIGLTRHFSIFDRSDSKRAIKRAMEETGIDPKQFDPAKILGAISRAKGNAHTQENYQETAGRDFYPNIVSRIWKNYEAILAKEKALDFDDLLLKTVWILKNHPDILTRYQNIWRYIHIDEYQDTNQVQYQITRLIAAKHRNICVVGDIDQMIYSWRGATLENILNFEKDYPDATVVVLEQNYRSTKIILEAANRIIEKNLRRREKKLFTENADGEPIGIYSAYDEADEADFIAQKISERVRGGVSPREIAILYRANFQSRVIEEAFLNHDIAYQVLGTRFFERKEVKDVLSYIRAALTPESSADIGRVINVPVRGIGKVTLAKVLSGQRQSLSPAIAQKINDFYQILEEVRQHAISKPPSETIKFVVKRSGLEAALRKTTSEEDMERLENIKELASLATRYDSVPPEEGIEQLLTDAALASDQDSLVKNQDAVKLMTVHASKGLEFDYVFITGLEEGLFPHERLASTSSDSGKNANNDDEEERRLFYVALTRARKKVYLSYAGIRTVFGSKQVNVPSEFIMDIDDDLAVTEERSGPGKTGIKTVYLD